jgi:hypothetical protein
MPFSGEESAMRHAIAIGLLMLAPALAAIAQDKQPPPPPYCNPCLFYGGDFDANGPYPNAMFNQDTEEEASTMYVPFAVPPNQTWTIAGLFSNNMVGGNAALSPPQIEWSISTGISQGNPGTVIASGTAYAKLTATGRSWNGLNEYTVLGKLNADELVTLTPGHYWMTAVPICIVECKSSFLISDVEDVPAPQAKGFESTDESYWYAPWDGWVYSETGGPNGLCSQEGGGGGCDKFSAGLLGTAQLN